MFGPPPHHHSQTFYHHDTMTDSQNRTSIPNRPLSVRPTGHNIANAFTDSNRKFYKYQYSTIGAEHAAEPSSLVGAATPNQGAAFNKAVMDIRGNSTLKTDPATDWPAWTLAQPYLNRSDGTSFQVAKLVPNGTHITDFGGASLRNSLDLVNAYTWEGGRGARCDFCGLYRARVEVEFEKPCLGQVPGYLCRRCSRESAFLGK